MQNHPHQLFVAERTPPSSVHVESKERPTYSFNPISNEGEYSCSLKEGATFLLIHTVGNDSATVSIHVADPINASFAMHYENNRAYCKFKTEAVSTGNYSNTGLDFYHESHTDNFIPFTKTILIPFFK
jgi:hypothetical protein